MRFNRGKRLAAITNQKMKHCTSLAFTILAFAGMLTGCRVRSVPFKHEGTMRMSGKMNGDMSLSGNMGVNGKLQTEILTGGDKRDSPLKPVVVDGDAKKHDQRIAIIDVDGILVDRNATALLSASENPVALFREKCAAVTNDERVKAVVLRINSPGGGATATDIMAREIERLRETRKIPIVACVMDVGTGGAYYLASQCDHIIAHPTSLVGGVGIILNVYNLEDTMGQFNILSTPIKSGEKIDAGTPERPIASGELEMLQQIADSFHQRFIGQIIRRRPDLQTNRDLWTDGEVFAGSNAAEVHLVDQIGYIDEAIAEAKRRADRKDDWAVQMYRRTDNHAYTVLDRVPDGVAMPSLFPIHIPGMDRSSMPTFLFMWQSDPAMASSL